MNSLISAELVRRLGQRWFNDHSLGTCDSCGHETPLERVRWDSDGNAMLALISAMAALGWEFECYCVGDYSAGFREQGGEGYRFRSARETSLAAAAKAALLVLTEAT